PELHVSIDRQGNQSSIGKLEVFWQPNGSSEVKIGNMGHFNVFTEINTRRAKIPLNQLPYGAGTVRVRYSKAMEEGEVYDEITFQR
ncbi:MAG: hypothetical protein AAF988_04780, partial [Pseudomonadota bacterium]